MRLHGVPLICWFIGLLGALMLAPSLHGALEGDWRSARLFLFAGVGVCVAAAAVGIAARSEPRRGKRTETPLSEVLTFAAIFTVAPAAAAAPIALRMPELDLMGAYFEAVSSLTTTGATLIARPEDAPEAVHLWRATLAWIGGLMTLTAAISVLAPRGLIDTPDGHGIGAAGAGGGSAGRVLALDSGGARAVRALSRLAPLYVGLTFALMVLLMAGSDQHGPGGRGFYALCHAMGAISTSGISPLSGGLSVHGTRWAEAAALLFMVLGASRLPWRRPQRGQSAWDSVRLDPELRLLALTVLLASLWLFGRHWLGVLQLTGVEENPEAALRALWGTMATVLSFATTTGYVSMDWDGAQSWSGLSNPAMMLLGLAALGGGVASTAGGLKLFRAFALFQHGVKELSHRSLPSAVDSPRRPGGRLERSMVTNALVFAMLFMATMAAALLALTLTGISFERSLVSAIAALANTGPALPLLERDPEAYTKFPEIARAILCGVMILGRIEVLAVIALMNPAWWRR